jgi:tRNA threonylcarbamoyladenosine biosynthesis protein TsaB
MKLLALDTSSAVAAVAVLDQDKLIAEYNLNHKKTHSQKMMPMMEEVLKSCELSPKDIDVFGVSLGPGSFTGLRIGITTMKVMAQALGKPLVGVSSLEGLAFNLPFCREMICPIVDAQRDLLYTGFYQWNEKDLQKVKDHDILHVEELISFVKERGQKAVFVGDGVEKFRTVLLERLPEQAVFPPVPFLLPRASSIGALAMKQAIKEVLQKPEEIVPVYMRKSQAERQLEQRMKGSV